MRDINTFLPFWESFSVVISPFLAAQCASARCSDVSFAADCGKRMEAVSWLDRYTRMTRRLAEAVIQAYERLPTQHVAQLFGLHWDSVRLLEHRS
jgi:hypothetical protein